jgi:probable addiction module antidote protein
MNKKRQHSDYHEFLKEELKDVDFALAYLKEALKDEDKRVFLLALKRVLDAHGENITHLAKETKLNRENLYKVFSKKGNPTWSTINSILHEVGFELTIQPYNKSR